jgi:hypothetical protein
VQRRTAVVIGFLAVIIGAVLVGTAVLGDVFVSSRVVSEYSDPRAPMALEAGRYPVEWFGPAKGSRPFQWDLDVEVRAQGGRATWKPTGSQWVTPVGDPYDDTARSALGTLEVRERSVVSMRFNPSIPTQGRPRIRVQQTQYPPVRTRGTQLLVGGLVALQDGCAVIAWGRSGRTAPLIARR